MKGTAVPGRATAASSPAPLAARDHGRRVKQFSCTLFVLYGESVEMCTRIYTSFARK